MKSVLVAAMLLVGVGFCVLGAVGMVRMPDLFTRMQAATKAGTLGAGFVMAAAAVHFGEAGVIVRCILVIAFLLLTAPIAAHVIARAAYSVNTPLWERTAIDELRTARRREPELSAGDIEGEEKV